MNVLELPRYQQNPFCLFFETYVLDVIGALPSEVCIEPRDVEQVFGSGIGGWREAVCTALGLSETIDVAILDRWYAWRDTYGEYEARYVPFAFAQDFADRYFEGGARLADGELEAARRRIASARSISS